MSDILLFNPPAPGGLGYTREGRCTQEAGVWGTQWPPLTLATAAALLRRDGHCVTLRDYPATGADLLSLTEDLRRLRPGFAIWSTGTPTLSSDLDIARVVRGNSPASVTAVIGTHVTVRPEEALCEPALNVVVRGEPEGIIRELCRCDGRWAEVPGISWRDDDGAIRRNPDAPWLDPGAIPEPDWDGLDCDAYRLPLKGRRFLITAPVRGCPYRCTFCTAPLYYGSRLRRRPVAQVVDEMAASISRYGIREFFIWADTFTADRRYVQELCRFVLEKGLRISWTCNSRVDTIDEETLRLMKQAGLWMISFGLESGNDAILAASGKGITAAQSREAVRMADRLGIRTAGHFMFGLPGETEETMAQTLALALSLPLDIAQFYAATPFPGTALYDDALREGWLKEAGKGGAFAQNSAVMELPGLPAARVNAFRREAYRRFYLRPRAATRVLSMAEPGALAGMPPLLRRFLLWLR
jgi:anaerobic magnesium-protoporphyrin IX monomethyl ester cyclase